MTALREVRLLGFPLSLWARSVEHHEELMREFQLLALSDDRDGVPRRLVELVDELTTDYASFTDSADAARDDAYARGDAAVDLVYRVPTSVAPAAQRLDAMLDEAEAFCRSGAALLTLAAPPEAVALRKWQLSEFVAQLGGASPTPWPSYERA